MGNHKAAKSRLGSDGGIVDSLIQAVENTNGREAGFFQRGEMFLISRAEWFGFTFGYGNVRAGTAMGGCDLSWLHCADGPGAVCGVDRGG